MDSRLIVRILIAGAIVLLGGCKGEPRELPTKGHLTMVVAETVAPPMKKEEQKFEELYPRASIDLQVLEDREAIARFFNDSIEVIAVARPLNAEEREVQKKMNMTIAEHKIALDAVAVIVNLENPVRQLRLTQVDSLLSGSMTEWSGAGWKGGSPSVTVIAPGRNSSTYEAAVTRILGGRSFAPSMKVASSSAEMILMVTKYPGAIGLVGMSWLAENKDRVQSLELTDPAAPDSLGIRGKYFSPHQAYVYQHFYPIVRDIYIYSRADNFGVGAGFTSFVTSGPGQQVLLNSGLVPATMPVRLVDVTNRGL